MLTTLMYDNTYNHSHSSNMIDCIVLKHVHAKTSALRF